MENNKQFDVTKADLQKAAEVLEHLRNSTANKREFSDAEKQEILKASPMAHLYADPHAALMEEDIIQKASEPLVAMAAFLAEMADGLNKAFKTLSDKVDVLATQQVETFLTIVKAQDSQLDVLKAVSLQPVEQFTLSNPETGQPVNFMGKAMNGAAPSNQFITEWIEKAVQTKEATITDMSSFEATQQIPQHLQEKILRDWAKLK